MTLQRSEIRSTSCLTFKKFSYVTIAYYDKLSWLIYVFPLYFLTVYHKRPWERGWFTMSIVLLTVSNCLCYTFSNDVKNYLCTHSGKISQDGGNCQLVKYLEQENPFHTTPTSNPTTEQRTAGDYLVSNRLSIKYAIPQGYKKETHLSPDSRMRLINITMYTKNLPVLKSALFHEFLTWILTY